MINESGRSMVEMLGVLAIIGVISIGGIAGYNYGMDKYRTNEVLDGANKRAYAVSTQITLDLPLDLSEFSENDVTAGGTFQSEVQNWGGEFGIQINGVKKEVCENILRMKGDNTPLRAVTKSGDRTTDLEAGGCDMGDSNNLYLVYNLDMAASTGGNSTRKGSTSGVSSTGGSSSSSTGSTSVCSTFPGTDPSYTGSVAGKGTDGTTDCKCPEYEGWDTTNEECVDNRPLYVDGGTNTTHYNMPSDGDCPSGYHWASSDEFIEDFNCSWSDEPMMYRCNASLGFFTGWFKDCVSHADYAVGESCNTAEDADNFMFGDIIFSPRDMNIPAVCRRN